MVAFDLKDESTRNQLCADAMLEGVMLLPCGEKSIRFRPYLIFDDAALDVLTTALKKVLTS